MATEWGNIINQHIASKANINHYVEDWGTKLLKINWKDVLELWELRNDKVKGSTTEEQNSNLRHAMIDKVIHLQRQYQDLPFELNLFINNDRDTLESMTTNALILYLFGVKLIIRTHRCKLALACKISRYKNKSKHPPRIHHASTTHPPKP
jgi:hypothetical protein